MSRERIDISRRNFLQIVFSAAAAASIPYNLLKTSHIPQEEYEEYIDNPDIQRPFSQRCSRGSGELECEEEWAKKPLPGGCGENRESNHMGTSGCSPAAIALVANRLLDVQTIEYITGGKNRITPDFVIENIFTDMGIYSINLTCSGTSSVSIIPALYRLGLTTRVDKKLGMYNISDFKTLNNEIIVGLISRNDNAISHWTVYSHGRGNVIWCDDSYYPTDTTGKTPFDLTNDFTLAGAIMVSKNYL